MLFVHNIWVILLQIISHIWRITVISQQPLLQSQSVILRLSTLRFIRHLPARSDLHRFPSLPQIQRHCGQCQHLRRAYPNIDWKIPHHSPRLCLLHTLRQRDLLILVDDILRCVPLRYSIIRNRHVSANSVCQSPFLCSVRFVRIRRRRCRRRSCCCRRCCCRR